MATRNREARPADEDTESDDSSSSSEGQRSLPVTAGKKMANLKKPTESVKAMDSGSESEDSDSGSESEDSDSGSESEDSDSDIPPKPSASKAMDDGAKLKKTRSKPNSKPVASPAKTPAKRSAAMEGEKGTKKLKEKGEGVGAKDEGKKSVLIQRLWSDDDEIVILKGMLDYKEKKGEDPMADVNGFHDFIKKSLHVDVGRRQLVDKVRRLRKRFHNSVGKKKSFSSHEKAAFELSKSIWGNEVESVDADQPAKRNVNTGKVSEPLIVTKPGTTGLISTSKETKGVENSGSGQEKTGCSWQFVGKASISMGLDEDIVKLGLKLCEEDRKAEIEEKWRQLHLEVFSRKLDLAREESKMIIEAFRLGKE